MNNNLEQRNNPPPTELKPSIGDLAPMVKIGKLEIPLYTTRLGKMALQVFGYSRGYSTEAARGVRDRLAKRITRAEKDPEVAVIDTEGLNVVIGVPVEQIRDTGSTTKRVRAATERLVREGRYRLRKKLPPGERTHPRDPRSKSQIVPTRSAGLGREILKRMNQHWPTGIVEFRGSAIETGIQMLAKRKIDTDLAQRVASVIMPDLDLFINMRFMDRYGNMNHGVLEFSFSENSLRFNPDGSPMESASLVKGQFFHPALISLKDFSHILSAHLLEQSGGQATINSDTLYKAFLLAPNADEDTRGIIEPYIYRMLAVGRINQLLTQHPGEFAGAIARTVNFTDQSGTPLSQEKAGIIGTELIGGMLGLPDATHRIKSLTYVDFVTMLNQIMKDHGAYLQWAGNSRLVTAAVETARSMPELHKLVKQMGVNNPESISETRKTMSAGDFFSLSMTPEILFIKAVAILEEEIGQAVVARAEGRRTLERVQTIIEIVEKTSEIDARIWAALRDEFNTQVKRLLQEGAQSGTNYGNGVVASVENTFREKQGS